MWNRREDPFTVPVHWIEHKGLRVVGFGIFLNLIFTYFLILSDQRPIIRQLVDAAGRRAHSPVRVHDGTLDQDGDEHPARGVL